MKGMVFTMLGELVEERYGLKVWDELIELTQPESEGIYISSDVYPDQELHKYVSTLSLKLKVPERDLVFAFGEYLLSRFYAMHPELFIDHTLRSFLNSVHNVIHVEVKKLHPDVMLPEFNYEGKAENKLVMLYKSPRKLCALAEGLIAGAAKHFGEKHLCEHSVCMHQGADHCRFELTFETRAIAKNA